MKSLKGTARDDARCVSGYALGLPMDLTEILAGAGVAPREQLEEAAARQVLYGFDLVTNLLELTELDEHLTQDALAAAFDCEIAPRGELPYATAAAIERVPRELATKHNAYPYRLEHGVLAIISDAPLEPSAAADFGTLLSVDVTTLIALAPRVRHAIARDYAFAVDRRTAKALARLDQRAVLASSNPPQRITEAPRISQLPRPVSVVPVAFPMAWSEAQTPAGSELLAETVEQPEVDLKQHLSDSESSSAETARSFQLPRSPGAPALPNPVPSTETGEADGTPPVDSERPHNSGFPKARRRGPYPTIEAKKDLLAANTAHEILNAYFDYATQYFDHSAVFTIHGQNDEGHRFRLRATQGLPDAAVVDKLLKVNDFPAVREVIDAGRWLPMVLTEVDPALSAVLGARSPHEALLMPLSVKQRCVALLFGALADTPASVAELGELLSFEALVARSLEQSIRSRKGGGSARASDRVRLPPVALSPTPFTPPPKHERAAAFSSLVSDSSYPPESLYDTTGVDGPGDASAETSQKQNGVYPVGSSTGVEASVDAESQEWIVERDPVRKPRL